MSSQDLHACIDRYRRAVERYDHAVTNALTVGNTPRDRAEQDRRDARTDLINSGRARLAELLDREFEARYALHVQLEQEEEPGLLDQAIRSLLACRRAVHIAVHTEQPTVQVPAQRRLYVVR